MDYTIFFIFIIIFFILPIVITIIAISIENNKRKNLEKTHYNPNRKPLSRAEIKGYYGEVKTYKELEKFLIQEQKYILRNLYVPYKDRTTEIDFVVITNKKIFVIENKNFDGWIFGSENDLYWTQTFKTTKNRFYNPIKQNRTHIKALSRILDIPQEHFSSVIVFGDGAELKRVPRNTNDYTITYCCNLILYCEKVYNTCESLCTYEYMESIYKILQEYTEVSEEIKTAHNEKVTAMNSYSNR